MAAESKTFVDSLSIKQADGTIGEERYIGVPFDRVFDSRRDGQGATLQQLYDNYSDFIKTSDFIYYGMDEPDNHRIRIWVDTSAFIEKAEGASQTEEYLNIPFNQLQRSNFHGSVRENYITFTGTLYQQPQQPFFFEVDKLNKWYPALYIVTAIGNVLVDSDNQKIVCADGNFTLITYVDPSDPIKTWTLYPSLNDETNKINGREYTLDFSKCVFYPNVNIKVPSRDTIITQGKMTYQFGSWKIEDERIIGSSSYMTGLTDLYGDSDERAFGYYLILNVDPWQGVQSRAKRSGVWDPWVPCKDDGTIVVWLGRYGETPVTTDLEIQGPAGGIAPFKLQISVD